MPDTSDLLVAAVGHHQAGRVAEAERAYRSILTIDPQCVSAWNLLGVLASQLNRHAVAVQCLQNALTIESHSAEIYYNLGTAWQGLERLDEAVVSYRQVLHIDPNHARAYNNLGAALKDQGRLEEAHACVCEALKISPNMAQAHCNLGNIFQADSNWDKARSCFERALELQPDFAAAHTNYAMVLLASGDYERGWSEYEWRWKAGQLPPRTFGMPLWDGSPLEGRSILLHAEQGLGDTLQFVRYAPLVKSLGAAVIVECPKALTRLLATCPGVDEIIGVGDQPPRFDCHAPLQTLPRLFKTSVATIPAPIPYLAAEASLVAQWRERLLPLPGLRVGINWRGRSGQGFFRLRDIPVACFAAFSALPVSLIALQQGATQQELAELSVRLPVFHPGDDFDQSRGAFMDTAAIMMNLDLVISSDTSLPHLAGALGVPTWIALPYLAGWQWMRDRTDSPWYPTMRLFRQTSPGDWGEVFEQIGRELQKFIGAR